MLREEAAPASVEQRREAALEPRKVLFLVSAMMAGGAERVASLLCNHWVEKGWDVTLMPTFSGRGECLYPLDERVTLDYLADRFGSTQKSWLNSFRRLLLLRRIVRETAPDVVVSFLTHVNVAALLATAGLRVPVLVSERIYPPLQPISPAWLRLTRLTYPRARAVVVQTRGIAGWVEGHAPGARTTVIPNPVIVPVPDGEPRVDPEQWTGRRRIVLSAGRLVEQKGFSRLLAAFAPLAAESPDWDLVILGDGPERAALEAERERLGLCGRAHLPGRVGNVGDWYRRADLFVLSSFFEGFPNALLEAMACGVPAVASDCPTGPSDIIRHGVDGLLVPNDWPGGLEAAMRRLMQDDAARSEMAGRAREAGARFSIDSVAAAWDRAIDDSLAAGR